MFFNPILAWIGVTPMHEVTQICMKPTNSLPFTALTLVIVIPDFTLISMLDTYKIEVLLILLLPPPPPPPKKKK